MSKIGKIYKSNDKLFTGFNKPRHVVVSHQYEKSGKFGVSRILSLNEKGGKKNNLLPIKSYGYFTKPSGIDYKIYSFVKDKNGNKKDINFGSMQDINICLDVEDINRMKKHVKVRGGKRNYKRYRKFKRIKK